MDVSIIIVSYNCRNYLEQCLHSVYSGSPSSLALETLVVENASQDGSAAMVREHFPQAILLENRDNLGFVKGTNQAIRQAKGRYILLLNPDAELFPGALQQMVAFLDQHSQAGGLGVKTWSDRKRTFLWGADKVITPALLLSQFSLLGRLFPQNGTLRRLWELDRRIWDCTDSCEVETIDGDCLLLRRKALDQVGLLDETFFMYFEDLDLCCRLKRGGWSLHYLARAEVAHYAWKSSGDRERAFRTFMSGLPLYLDRYFGPVKRIGVLAAMVGSFWVDRAFQSLGTLKGWIKKALRRKNLPARRVSLESPSVSWPAVPGTSEYWLEVSYHQPFLYKGATKVKGTQYTAPEFVLRDWPDGSYFVRVAPLGPEGKMGEYYTFAVSKSSVVC